MNVKQSLLSMGYRPLDKEQKNWAKPLGYYLLYLNLSKLNLILFCRSTFKPENLIIYKEVTLYQDSGDSFLDVLKYAECDIIATYAGDLIEGFDFLDNVDYVSTLLENVEEEEKE